MLSTERLKIFKYNWINYLLETNLASSVKPSNKSKQQFCACSTLFVHFFAFTALVQHEIPCRKHTTKKKIQENLLHFIF